MKDSVQIKANLVAGEHDALIEFYGRFNRLFVNKLLLKLCEGVIPDYEPSLALFQSNVSENAEVARKVAIRIEKDKHPLMWAFYKDLPYGSRTMVIINLMNHYATLADADPRLMEKTYWSRRPEPTHKDTSEPAVHVVDASKLDQRVSSGGESAGRVTSGADDFIGKGRVDVPATVTEAQPGGVVDPVTLISTGL